MSSVAPNHLAIRKALNADRKVYSVLRHPKLYLAADGKGGGSWRIKYQPRPGASQRWVTISNDARNADFQEVVKKAGEMLGGLAIHGIDPKKIVVDHASGTFTATFEDWLERYARNHKKSWEADDRLFNRHIRSRLGSDVAGEVDRPRVIEVLDDIAEKATPLQANRCQSLISAVFSWALDEGRIRAHPALRIRRRGEEKVRALILSDAHLKSFWKATDLLDATPSAVLKLLLLLGPRLGEVVGMTEHELHLTSAPYWLIPAERTKNGRSSVVPLPATAVKIISEALQRVMRGEFVFPARRLDPMAYDGNHVSRECKALFRSLGVGDMRLHDLRHQAATGMAQCGVPLDIRQLVQNQISGRQQRIGSRYDQHDYLQEKRRALELWERRLLAVVEDREIPNERY